MKRGLILAGLLAAGFSTVFVLPDFKEVESAMNMELPDYLGRWNMESYPPSEKEIKILAKDTRFSKAYCALPRSEEFSYIFGRSPVDHADLSVVLSGYDLANSIHRPERCMPAQGHRGLRSSASTLDLPNGGQLPVTRILSYQDLSVQTPEGPRNITRHCVTFYFFVGHSRITENHTERTLIDIYDRVFKGQAQGWAYVSVTMPYSEAEPYESGNALLPLDQADQKIRQLLSELAVNNIDWEQIQG